MMIRYMHGVIYFASQFSLGKILMFNQYMQLCKFHRYSLKTFDKFRHKLRNKQGEIKGERACMK